MEVGADQAEQLVKLVFLDTVVKTLLLVKAQ